MPTLDPLAEAELCVPATMTALAARARPACASRLSFMRSSLRAGRSMEELLPAKLIDLDPAGGKSINPTAGVRQRRRAAMAERRVRTGGEVARSGRRGPPRSWGGAPPGGGGGRRGGAARPPGVGRKGNGRGGGAGAETR